MDTLSRTAASPTTKGCICLACRGSTAADQAFCSAWAMMPLTSQATSAGTKVRQLRRDFAGLSGSLTDSLQILSLLFFFHLVSRQFRYNSRLAWTSERMETPLHNALLIHNPNAGNGGNGRRRLLDQARRILATNGMDVELAETTGPGHAVEIAQQAVRDRRELVIACGGDGTLNEVVNGLATYSNGHRVPLALLPGGTANILAKELDLPWDIPRAAKRLVHGEVREVALGVATPLEQPERKRYFLSVSGAGPDGMIVYSVDLGLKARVGILAYWWQGAREVLRYTFPRFRVRAGDRQLEATLVVVGRTKNYGGPFKITDQADLFEDQFEIMALTTQSGLRYLSYLPTLWMGNLRKEQDVHFWKAHSLVCEPLDANPVYAQVDGEPLARLPIEFSIAPRALKLLVPSAAARNGSSSKT
jgi:diacylglycerol kinase (ATP)